MSVEESKKKYQRVVAWSYLFYALLALLMAMFSGLVDPQTMDASGGKSGFYFAIFEVLGFPLEPIFGRYSTSAIFVIVSIGLLYVWRRKYKVLNINEL